jgi:hypothetical protein
MSIIELAMTLENHTKSSFECSVVYMTSIGLNQLLWIYNLNITEYALGPASMLWRQVP